MKLNECLTRALGYYLLAVVRVADWIMGAGEK
jgi:hypothetical protein